MEKDLLLGRLIGLARATDGSEHLINPDATAVIIESLTSIHTGHSLDGLAAKVTEEKRKMIPDCFTCACPCGRTEDYDLQLMHTAAESVRELKYRLLSEAARLAANVTAQTDTSVFYRALIALGMEDTQVVENILEEVTHAGA